MQTNGNYDRLVDQITDMVLGISAGLLLIVGVARVFLFEKGSDYYFHSYAFIAKLSVFILIGLLSVFPTVEFLSWNAALREGKALVQRTFHQGGARPRPRQAHSLPCPMKRV